MVGWLDARGNGGIFYPQVQISNLLEHPLSEHLTYLKIDNMSKTHHSVCNMVVILNVCKKVPPPPRTEGLSATPT